MAPDEEVDLREYILALKSEDSEIRKRAGWKLANFQTGKVSDLILNEINDAQNQLYVRCEAVQILGKLEGEQAFQALTKFIWHENSQIRHSAIHALRYRGDKRAFEPLSKLLQDQDDYIRGSTAAALGDLQESKAIPLLIYTLLNDSFAFTRGCAAYSLGRLKAQESLETLASALNDADYSVKQSVIKAIVDLESPQATQKLIELMENANADWQLRLEIASRLISYNNNKAAIQTIIQALGEQESPLGTIIIANRLGNRISLALIEALKSPNRLLRLQAAQTLGHIGDKRAIKGLSNLAERIYDDTQLKKVVLEALDNIKRNQLKKD